MENLKTEATKLGLDFKGNISRKDLTNLIDEATKATAEVSKPKKIKVIITPRDDEEKEGYVGLNGYSAQYKFEEEIDMPLEVVEFLKSKGTYQYDAKGNKKWYSRFIIEKL